MTHVIPPDGLVDAVVSVLAKLRQEAGWSLDELADRTGLHRTSLGLIERRERGVSLGTAEKLADAFNLRLSALVTMAEASEVGVSSSETVLTPRRLPESVSLNEQKLLDMTGLEAVAIRSAVEHVYETLDLIDAELIARSSEPISALVELANLSSMIGNLVGAGLAEASAGLFRRNRPHAFPDLVPQRADLPELEIKTALETNSPKGHLPKEGVYLTFRYVLGGPGGEYSRGRDQRGKTAWIWEVRLGRLTIDDFSISNTQGDSGKTAVITGPAFKRMSPVFFDPRFFPYARAWGGLSKD